MLLAACARTPYTGRVQPILVSTEQESVLGAQALREALGKNRLDTRPAVAGPVETGVSRAWPAARTSSAASS